jgi:hypothetical protein
MKAVVFLVLILAVIVLAVFLLQESPLQPKPAENLSTGHIYVSWDTMEFDKCVAAWLITRFIDRDAQFVFVPSDTEIKKGRPFDIPGAQWSRKHRKCTSQCILESMDEPDPAIERIVTMASRTELNFWQLDRWPQTQKYFYEVKEIMDQAGDPLACIEKTNLYFDRLYSDFKANGSAESVP